LQKKKTNESDDDSTTTEEVPISWEKSPYELLREAKVAANKERLRMLGLGASDDQVELTRTAETIVGHRAAAKKKGYWELQTKWVTDSSSAPTYTWESIKVQKKKYPELVKDYMALNPEVAGVPPRKEQPSGRLTRSTAALANEHEATSVPAGEESLLLNKTEKAPEGEAARPSGSDDTTLHLTRGRTASPSDNAATSDPGDDESSHTGSDDTTLRLTRGRAASPSDNAATSDPVGDESLQMLIDEQGGAGKRGDTPTTTEIAEEPSIRGNTDVTTAEEPSRGNTDVTTSDDADRNTTIDGEKTSRGVPLAKLLGLPAYVAKCRFSHDGPANFKDETNPAYAKTPYYLSGKMCVACQGLITNKGKGGRTEEEGQIFVKPSTKYPVFACLGVPENSCNQVLCSSCFQTKFLG